MGFVEFAILAVTSIIAVMEPASTIAVFMVLAKDVDKEKQRKIIAKSTKISFVVLTFFALTGHLVFLVFNITAAAFEIAGGILLVNVALKMLNPRKEQYSTKGSDDIAIIPLAFPLTAGPGTITATILLASKANSFFEGSFIFVGIFTGILISYVGMRYSSKLFKVLGGEGLRVITALLSIIILAMAVQFVISGMVEVGGQILSSNQ